MTSLQQKEYDYLRNEINQKISLHNTLVTFSLTISVTIISIYYAKTSAPNSMLLLPFCILIPMAFRVAYYRRALAKLSAYMIVFLENYEEKDNESFHWETRLKHVSELGIKVNIEYIEELKKSCKNFEIFKHGFPRHLEFLMMALASDLLYWINCHPNIEKWKYALLIILTFVVFAATVDMASTHIHKRLWVKRWELIKGEKDKQ